MEEGGGCFFWDEWWLSKGPLTDQKRWVGIWFIDGVFKRGWAKDLS